MKMLNVNICSNCGSENPLYIKICNNCKHYIRTSTVNIDLWHTIYLLFENPYKALKNIIYAEHKNFIVFLLFFLSVKLYLLTLSINSATGKTSYLFNSFFNNFLIGIVIFIFLIVFYSKIISYILNIKSRTRFKDNLSLILYSSIPIIFTLFILTPVQYGIFGEHWFYFNPSPFLIKSNLAYILSILEGLMIIWSFTILIKAFHIQSNSILLSFILSFFFFSFIILFVII